MEKKIFDNSEKAFILKSDKELNKSIFIFRLMSRQWMVSVGTWLTNFSLKFKLPVKSIIRNTIFNQFCGGETSAECIPVIKKYYEHKVFTVFDYASEIRVKTDEELEKDIEDQIELANFALQQAKAIPFLAIKPTQLGSFDIWAKVDAKEKLTAAEQKSWEGIRNRVDRLCKHGHDIGLRIMVDAEEFWIQTAVDDLIEEMMEKYNKERIIVFSTVQCYRWDRPEYMLNLLKKAKAKGFKIGMKLVRGAYMEKENERAAKMGYPTPICKSKQETDDVFNSVLRFCLNNIEDISVYIGTHNEESSYLAMEIMKEKGIAKYDKRVWFSQLYGMSDNITFNLADKGYNSCKYMPFGKVDEVIPYLIRRAEENSSVKGQTGRELSLLLEERERRKNLK